MDYERLTETSETFTRLAMARPMEGRLARARWFLDSFSTRFDE
jgi:hypothetical protein